MDESIEFDEADLHHQHIRSNVKNTGDSADHQTWYGSPAVTYDPLDGDLGRNDLAMLVGVTNWGTDVNIANASSQQVNAAVHITREVSLDSEPHFATRDYERDDSISSDQQDAGDSGELQDLQWQTDSDLGDVVLLVDRLSSYTGLNDSTNGAAAGVHSSVNPSTDFTDFLNNFGGPVIVDGDDEIGEFYLENTGNEGGTMAWSSRVHQTYHWYVFEGEKPEFPELRRS